MFKVSTTSTHTWSQMVTSTTSICLCWWWTLWTHALTRMFIYMIHQHQWRSGQVKTSLLKRFRRSSISWIFISCTLCCITPIEVNFRRMMTLDHFNESMIHLMPFSLVISCCNVTFSVFWLPQGSVATLIKWVGWGSYCCMWRSFLNLTVKNCVKIVDFR